MIPPEEWSDDRLDQMLEAAYRTMLQYQWARFAEGTYDHTRYWLAFREAEFVEAIRRSRRETRQPRTVFETDFSFVLVLSAA